MRVSHFDFVHREPIIEVTWMAQYKAWMVTVCVPNWSYRSPRPMFYEASVLTQDQVLWAIWKSLRRVRVAYDRIRRYQQRARARGSINV